MKHKNYNPFKMPLVYIFIIFASLKIFMDRFLCGIWSAKSCPENLIFSTEIIILAFLLGWLINSLWRKFRK